MPPEPIKCHSHTHIRDGLSYTRLFNPQGTIPPNISSTKNMIPHTKLLLLKYIHQYLDIFPYIHLEDTMDGKEI